MDRISINICRPYPGTEENENQISFIEPLRKAGRVYVNQGYLFNLSQFLSGQEPSLSPGYKYVFTFLHNEDAMAFKLKFNGEIYNVQNK